MKKKSLFLALIVIMVTFIITACSNSEYTLKLPTDATGVTLFLNSESRTYENAEDVENILNTIAGKERITSIESIQDAPDVTDETIKIDFIFEQGATSTLFCYRKNDQYYIEQPYNGIYEITQDEYNDIKRLLE